MDPSWGRGWDREAVMVCLLHMSLSGFTLQHFYCVSLKTDKLTWKRQKILPAYACAQAGGSWVAQHRITESGSDGPSLESQELSAFPSHGSGLEF